MSLYAPQKDSIPGQALNKPASKEAVVLQPIAMRIPNRYGVYSPSRLRPPKTMLYAEFLSRYADYPLKIRVCFDETPVYDTLLQNSRWVTAYGAGLDCWYIVASDSQGDNQT